MFQSAVRKLTFWYIGALVSVCIIFTLLTYGVASARLERGARRQADISQGIQGQPKIGGLEMRLRNLRDEQLKQDRNSLKLTLLLTNLGVLLIGSYFSYLFAKRTLQPIEESHAAQTRFAQDASHELRTPLAVMMAETEVALGNNKLSISDAKNVLNSNLEEIRNLRDLSEQLLDLTRLDSGDLKMEEVNMSKLLGSEISKLNKRYRLKISADISPDIMVIGNKHLLAQVLTILIDNAVAHSGNIKPSIMVSLSTRDSNTEITVSDNGIGISPSHQEHIFDRFYSVHQPNTKKGHGLGLALAKQISVLHGGTISVSSRQKQGATFTVTLPLSTSTT